MSALVLRVGRSWRKVTLGKGFPGDSAGKESACNAGDRVQSLGWEGPLEKGKATHSSILTLENSMDSIFHGVAKRWTQLSDFHFTSTLGKDPHR